MPARGVYFLANDKISDLVIAFLNSFRKYNPDANLCLIPFDANIESISMLRHKYGFRVYSHAAALDRCDRMAEAFHGRIVGHYRKFVAWEGPFDEFIYIDSDTVVLENIEFVFDLLTSFDFVTSVSNLPSARKWVWKDSAYVAAVLSPEQLDWAANTGFIASKRGALELAEAERKLPAALGLSRHMELISKEQAFLNYLVVTSGKRHTSLHCLRLANPSEHLPGERWGRDRFGFVFRGRVMYPQGIRLLLVHWAGSWQPTSVERRVFTILRKLGLAKEPPQVRLFMRNGRLWRYYRNLSGPRAGE
jgi:hypothetical protein